MALAGDTANLQDVILSEFNDKTGKFIEDEDLILYLNRIHRLVAEKGIYVVTETFDAVADQYIYDLSTVLDEDFISLLDLTWEGDDDSEPMHAVANPYEFKALRRQSQGMLTPGQPYIYTTIGMSLRVWPAPTSAGTDAFEADYSYQPDDMEDDAGYSFPDELIRTWYPVYEYGALWMAFKKAAPSPKSKALAQENYLMFQEQLRAWKGSQRLRGNLTVRPG